MTIFVATSVIRGSRQGESHGGVYLVDFETEKVYQPLDWNTMDIDWQGRGWDRGLRGIAFDGEVVYIAASDELFAWKPDFRPIGSWRSPWLKHCHEICAYQRMLFLTSTGFDAILGFDLDRRRFVWGMHVEIGLSGPIMKRFDPSTGAGPPPGNRLHLNNVWCGDAGMFISGARTRGLLRFNGRELRYWASLPEGVHNARPFRDGVLFNDTEADVVRFATREREQVFPVPRFPAERLRHTDLDERRIARQAFGRGLCVVDADRVAAGSSPSTIALHDLAAGCTRRIATLSFDVRNAIHGLEVWPFGA